MKDANGNPTNDYVGKMVNEAAVENGDVVDFFFYKDVEGYNDKYAYFTDDAGNFVKSLTVTPGESYTLNVKAYTYAYYSLSKPEWRALFVENVPEDIIIADEADNYTYMIDNGQVTIDVPADATGSYTLYGKMFGSTSDRYVMPHIEINVAN